MEIINYEDLKFIDTYPNDIWSSGSFGIIKRCSLNDKIYVLKDFGDNESYLRRRKRKLFELSNLNIPGLILPEYWVKKNHKSKGYLTIFEDKKAIYSIANDNNYDKIRKLQSAKKLLLTMHSEGIIHSDIHDANILIKNNTCSFIDFDNCTYKHYKTKIKDSNDYCIDFIKKYHIAPELDIFMFNILTYYIINNDVGYFGIRNKIHQEKYGIFNNKEGIRICKSFFLDDKVPNKDFLIDTIDETRFSI